MLKQVNLIPAHRRTARERARWVRRWCALSTLYALAVLAATGACLIARHDASGASARRLAALGDAVADGRRSVDDLGGELEQAQTLLAANRAVLDKPDWSMLLKLLNRTTAGSVVLRRCEVRPRRPEDQAAPPASPPPAAAGAANAPRLRAAPVAPGQPGHAPGIIVRLEGLGRSQSEVTQFVVRLEQLGLFDQVRLLYATREPVSASASEAVVFEIRCTFDRFAEPER